MNVLVLGSGPQALFVLRSLSKAGHQVTVLSFDCKVANFSKYGTKVIANNPVQFISHIRNVENKIEKVFICGGKELQFVIDEFPGIFDDFDVYPKPLEAIKVFSDKLTTYKYLANFGINAPKCYGIENLLLLDELKNPLIVKWNQEVMGSDLVTFKTKILETQVELRKFFSELNADVWKYLVVQDFIVGGDTNNISFQVAFKDKVLKGSLLAAKLRVSKNGFTSYIEEIDMSECFREKVYQPFVAAMVELNYSGLAEAEFKICARTGKYYLIEVNPRPCGLVSALGGKYLNINHFFEGKDLITRGGRKKVKWSSILRDIQSSMVYYKTHRSVKRFIKDIASISLANTYDIFDPSDIKPFISQVTPKQ